MHSILEVKEALTARSRTESLDDLRDQGRHQVRVIKAQHIAAMVEDAVQRAMRDSGMVSRDEAESLVQRSKSELKKRLKARESELAAAQTESHEAAQLQQRCTDLETELHDVIAERDRLLAEMEAGSPLAAHEDEAIEELRNELVRMTRERDQSVTQLLQLTEEHGKTRDDLRALQQQAAVTDDSVSSPAAAPQAAAPQAAAPQPAGPDLGAVLSQLEKLGRKMGVSSAVDAPDLNFEGMFSAEENESLESNLDSVEVKQSKQSGIAANLERLKKLKRGE